MNDFLKAFNRVPLVQKVLALVLVVCGVVVLWYLLIYAPVGDDITKEQTKWTNLLKEEVEIKRKVANKAEIEEELTSLRGRKAKIEKELWRRHNWTCTEIEDTIGLEKVAEVATGVALSQIVKVSLKKVRFFLFLNLKMKSKFGKY